MALGDGIRRNYAKIDQAERDRFVAAVQKMNNDPAFQFSDGISYFKKQEETHELAHGSAVSPHDPAVFLVWHRELINRFEKLLRVVDPDLSLHYWDWTEDPRNASDGMGGHINLMTASQMGDDGSAGINRVPGSGPGTSGGDVGAPFANFETESPGPLGTPDPQAGVTPISARTIDFPGHTFIWRKLPAGPPPGAVPDTTFSGAADYPALINAFQTPHAAAHNYFGGTLQIEHLAASDPFFFLFHANVDRLFALWQLQPGHPERLNGATIYGPLGSNAAANSTMLPWDGSTGAIPWVAGNTEPTGGVDAKTAKDPSVVAPPCYDTNPPQISVANSPITFNDVPAGETAMRAAVLDCVVTGSPLHFTISAGPTAPYTVLVGSAVANPKCGQQQVRIWLTFTGGTAGTSAPAGSVTVHCTETGDNFVFSLQANTIARPTVAVELVLDQSGSMDANAGMMGVRRIDVLKSAAGVFADVIQGGNSAGLVRFDTVAYGPTDPTFPGLAVTGIGSNSPSDPGRMALQTAIQSHHTNPAGVTSIGAGVQLGRSELNPVTGVSKKAMLVFTDGLENTRPWIADVMSSIDSETFAIGLGDASQVSTAALTQLTNNTGGFLLLTDTLTPSTDDFFRVKKYFLQILAGVQNNQVVLDPTGKLLPGQVESIPFQINDADIQATVILLTDQPAIHMRLRTPAGDMIDPVVAASVGAEYTVGQNLVFYRFLLPVALGAGAKAGTWNAVLEMDPAIVKRCKQDRENRSAAFASVAQPSVCNGVRYSVQVHAWSNLHMEARVLQTSFAPGASLMVRAVLTEYGAPVDHRAAVTAEATRPDGTQFSLTLAEIEPGVFEASTKAMIPGVYKFTVRAAGKTLRGIPFTREQFLTGAVFYGGDNPLPTGGQRHDLLCCTLTCLLRDPGVQAAFKQKNIDPARLLRCLEACCADQRGANPPEPV